jgi:hypothetical protein
MHFTVCDISESRLPVFYDERDEISVMAGVIEALLPVRAIPVSVQIAVFHLEKIRKSRIRSEESLKNLENF